MSTRAILLSFSLYTNASKILNTKQPSGTLTAVNGIRFISMTWVILGHTFVFGLPAASKLSSYSLCIVWNKLHYDFTAEQDKPKNQHTVKSLRS